MHKEKRTFYGLHDICIRVTYNFKWTNFAVSLHMHGSEGSSPLLFRAEKKGRIKEWSGVCYNFSVKENMSWPHKNYTDVRIRFCSDYGGKRIQFAARVDDMATLTTLPVVVSERDGSRSECSGVRTHQNLESSTTSRVTGRSVLFFAFRS